MKHDGTSGFHVAIVGGGAAGTFGTLNLARLPGVARLTVFDRDNGFGRGLAYSASAPWHRINVPAYKMGGWGSDDPDGFVDWLAANDHPTGPDYSTSFVPRRIYGDYLLSSLTDAAARGTINLHPDAVIRIEPHGPRHRIHTAGGAAIDADMVLLCPGNPPPSGVAAVDPSSRFIGDVWAAGALDQVGPDDDVMVIGTAATAVDVVMDLFHRGVGRRITLLSRRGLLPREDVEPTGDPVPFEIRPSPTVRSLFRQLRRVIRDSARCGVPWQSVIDGFRLQTTALWQTLPPRERAQFSRHLRSIWLVHRHRLAPDVARLLAELQQQGRLRVVAGRLRHARATPSGYDVSIKPRGGETEHLAPDWILNCTGPEERYERLKDPLIASLLASGKARPGHMGIGLDVSPDCLLHDSRGKPQNGLYLIGPATRGSFWEVTSATNIRQQALVVAEHVQASLCPAELDTQFSD